MLQRVCEGQYPAKLDRDNWYTRYIVSMVYQVAAIVSSDGLVERLPESATPQLVLGKQVRRIVYSSLLRIDE